ncbi:MAG TPA: DUF937 domain-containing protein [Rubrivivax sp.]|nr:DUF937 domain-containing protein [Rubrivivax sp.]
MQLTDLLARMGGLESMARDLGVDERQVATGADALLPAILGGFKKQAQAQPVGVEGLDGLLGQLGGGGLLDEVLAPQPTNAAHGNDVLGQIFGSKDVSRTVAQNAAAQSGLDPSLLKQMLPLLAMVVTGLMARQGGAAPTVPGGAGGLGDVLAGALGGGGGGGGGLGGLLGGLLGGQGTRGGSAGGGAGGLAGMLDMDGNGNPLDDILRIACAATAVPRRIRAPPACLRLRR